MTSGFEALGLSPALMDVLVELGHVQPTPIQGAAIPALLAGRDLIGQAQTGSGKTAAFGLPLIQRLSLEPRSLQALVLCPTRELATQVARELRKLGRRHAGFTVLEVVGGQPSRAQREALARGVHVVVGTPGRVLDQLSREALDARSIHTVVLDEADRMLDMGFGADVTRILRGLSKDHPGPRQTVLFSATFPAAVEELAAKHQRDAERVCIEAPADEPAAIRELLLQTGPQKLGALAWLLERFPHESALIFCSFKATVAELTRELAAAGISAGRLDGDLDTYQRHQVLARFRNESLRVLVATDVAGRGIDVEDLDLVINYELPPTPETYLHRIGRTGRAGRTGTAITLTRDPRDERIVAAEALTGTRIEVLTGGPEPGANAAASLRRSARRSKMETVLIQAGRRDKLRPGDVLGALTGDGGLLREDVGKIEVGDRATYVAVVGRLGRQAAQTLDRGRIKGKRFRATLLRD